MELAADVPSRLGFYGCASAGVSRVVRIAWAGEGKPPRSALLTCPVCRLEHRISPAWRKPVALDADRETEAVVR